MLSLNLESRILGLAQAQGLLAEASAEAMDPALVLDPKALQTSSIWGPRLDRLMAEGKLETATVEALAWSLLNPGKGGSPDESWMAGALPSVLPDLEGRTVADRYERLAFLGEGALGRVYKAYDTLLHRWVALKFLKTTIPGQEAALLTEARAQAQVEHPHVCRIYEVGESEDHGFIAMQWVEGTTLAQAMADMTLREKVSVVRDLAEGVHAAHRRDLVHLDLKPGNVLGQRDDQGRWQALVTDFGMMRSESGNQAGPCPMGTPPYSSPEQLQGDASLVDRRSDVYSMGVMLHVMLTGEFPFEAASFTSLLDAIREAKPKPLRAQDRNLPEDLEAVVSKCLEKAATSRYPSGQALADDLQRFLDGEVVQAQSTSLRYRTRKWMARNRVAAWVGSMGLVAILVAGGVGIATTYQARRQGEWAQHFEQIASSEEAKLRQEYAMPPHDMRPIRESLRRAIRQIEGELLSGSPTARGPAHYALGRIYALLHRDQDALRHLEIAYECGFRTPEVKVALAGALLNQHQWLWFECNFEMIGNSDHRRELLKKNYLDRVDALLKGLSPTASMNPLLTRVLILREYSHGNQTEAYAWARSVAEKERPLDFEAWIQFAILGMRISNQLFQNALSEEINNHPVRMQELWLQFLAVDKQAEGAIKKALELAPGCPEAKCFMMEMVATRSQTEAKVPSEIFQSPQAQLHYYFGNIEANRLANIYLQTDPDDPILIRGLAAGLVEIARTREDLLLDVGPAAKNAMNLLNRLVDYQSTSSLIPAFQTSRALRAWAVSESLFGIRNPEGARLLSQALREERIRMAKWEGLQIYMDRASQWAYSALSDLTQMMWEVGEDPMPLAMEWTAPSFMADRPPGSLGVLSMSAYHVLLARIQAEKGHDPSPYFNRARELLGPPSMRSQGELHFLNFHEKRWGVSRESDSVALHSLEVLIENEGGRSEMLKLQMDILDLQLDHIACSFRLNLGPGNFISGTRGQLTRMALASPQSTEVHERIARLCLLEAIALERPIPKLLEGIKAANRALIYPRQNSDSVLKRPGFIPPKPGGQTREVYHKGRTLKIKGELELALAKAQKTSPSRLAKASKALATLEESLKENKNLARHLNPLIEEARRLARN